MMLPQSADKQFDGSLARLKEISANLSDLVTDCGIGLAHISVQRERIDRLNRENAEGIARMLRGENA